MVKQLNKALEEVITCITDSNDYKECIRLKSLMDNNSEIKELVEKIKELPKFGNDLDEVDLIGREVAYTYTKPVERYENPIEKHTTKVRK